jgi:hypothetical protein
MHLRIDVPAMEDLPGWGILGSIVLHAILAILFARGLAPDALPLIERSVEVEFLSAEEFEAASKPREPRQDEAPGIAPTITPSKDDAASPPVHDRAGKAPPPAMIHATRMLSARALADPRSRTAREALPLLDDTERMVQLCDLEAMEQVGEWRPGFRPERVVAYALSEVAVAGDMIVADGAAFLSERSWYGLKFKCGLSPGHDTVVAFEFLVGDRVPKADWDASNLEVER